MESERSQTANRVFMIRPTGFGRDDEAAQTNHYMNQSTETQVCVQERALREFDALVAALREADVSVMVFEDDLGLPDSIFPNNWVSFHQPIGDGESQNPLLVTYPMLTQSRRKERRSEILDSVSEFTQSTPDHLDLSNFEDDEEILEGTGSLVLDRVRKIAFASLSGRTTEDALDAWADETGYSVIRFHSADSDGNPIYHTNVMLSIGSKIAVVCLSSITDPDEYDLVKQSLIESGRELIEISVDQVNYFCGNILELQSKDGQSVFAMSSTAFEHFSDEQREVIQSHGQIVHADIPTIEFIGGGSVRCMIAELGNWD